MKRLLIIALAVSLLLALCGCKFAYTTSGTTGNQTTTNTPTTEESGKQDSLDPTLKYYADIEIKEYGKITILLEQDDAPITCANFVKLAKSGFYDGLTFHRIMEGFMMQGGDPLGSGYGDSGKTIRGEFKANGFDNPLSHTRGAISMARGNEYNSASCQFFIVHQDSVASLDGKYACFGYVTEGMEVVDEVCTTAQPTDLNGTIPREQQPVITKVTIRTEPKQ